eukprot:5268741-Prorocentrum_lima.AAC.1
MLWHIYAHHMTRFAISGFAAGGLAAIYVESSNPLVIHLCIILNAETEELNDLYLHTSMVLRGHGLLTYLLLADWGENIDPNILMSSGSIISEFMEPDTKLDALSN